MNPKPLYTKTGDQGKSNLIDGLRLPKHHPAFEVLGTLDELNAHLGYAALIAPAKTQPELYAIQHHLLTIGALIAGSSSTKLPSQILPHLEKSIDYYQSHTKNYNFTAFVLPGGTQLAAHLDLSRAVCRRLERRLSTLYSSSPKSRPNHVISSYLNRLSDYLFALRSFQNSQSKHHERLFRSTKR